MQAYGIILKWMAGAFFMRDDQTLSHIYNAATGNVGEINSVLIAMLRSQKIQTDPVILATRDEGLTNQPTPYLIITII